MSITIEQIDHLAHLARLELTPSEKKKYQKDISAILEYVKKIQKIHEKTTIAVIPAQAGIQSTRDDIVANCQTDEREAIIKAFPEKEGNLNKVKAVFD
ncbi:MAG: Asp-tRNA(Asn)/Glu-tRNA(Gln) amidotransferase subunit GatC [Candidatus Magasanikbacteria bacterium]|nr:Asp-tRNA(Asn)/Glu-tRNA(Gln) amidotransferase subunit GatC [Candidatus Magasanikbacteria bacterium]